MTTKLKSADGELFTVPNNLLQKSETLASMLNLCSDDTDDTDDTVTLDKIHSKYLKIIVPWLQSGSIRSDDLEFNDLYHLLVHANYLNIPDMLDQLCKLLVDQIAKRKKLHKIEFDLISEPRCFYDKCKSSGGGPGDLKVCAKCSIAKYCCKDCQSQDWADHKRICKKISTLTKTVNKEAAHLSTELWGEPGNTFEEEAGHFWGILETRPYCRARYGLAEAILELADEKKQSFIYEKALAHNMELLRLIHSDNMGIRYEVPFVFLMLNRDEDCYNFLKWWGTIDPHGRYNWGDPPESKEGDWLYLTDQDLLENPLKFINMMELQVLAAFLWTRMRIVSRYRLMEAVEKQIKSAVLSKDKELRCLLHILPSLEKTVLGKYQSKSSLKIQEEIMKQLLEAIEMCNKTFLPALINPEPLLSCQPPSVYSRGSSSEAYIAVKQSLGMFSSISIAKDVIKDYCGDNTDYDVKMDTFNNRIAIKANP